jgi:hypothetical protein
MAEEKWKNGERIVNTTLEMEEIKKPIQGEGKERKKNENVIKKHFEAWALYKHATPTSNITRKYGFVFEISQH